MRYTGNNAPQKNERKSVIMKKFVAVLLSLLLCVSVLTGLLQEAGYAAGLDPDPKPTVTALPGGPKEPKPTDEPDGVNEFPAIEDVQETE